MHHLLAAVAEEMGVALERAAFSPNIRERRDYSCAIFTPDGALLAQAAHIPVHLGAFPLLMERLLSPPGVRWRPGDALLCNDPRWGGTHLPDLSLISPVFAGDSLAALVASRAHHSDIGGFHAGSMGPCRDLYGEGLIIPPVKLQRSGRRNRDVFRMLLANVRTPREREGDLAAQVEANRLGILRIEELLARYSYAGVSGAAAGLRRRTREQVAQLLMRLPQGVWRSSQKLDAGEDPPATIHLELAHRDGRLVFDFSGTTGQLGSSLNATEAVTRSAVYYCILCLLPDDVIINQGAFDLIEVVAPGGTLVNAGTAAPVAAGNVETSQRIVDTILDALAEALPDEIPAASQGTMNNVTLGGIDPRSGERWTYYETMGGGAGAAPGRPGASAVHTHMSNTRNTPVEALELAYPLRVVRYELREQSGGAGEERGGDGVVREIELLAPATAGLLTSRRSEGPPGVAGGEPGKPGLNELDSGGGRRNLPPAVSLELPACSRLRISSPGGGGCGEPPASAPADDRAASAGE